MPYSAAMIGDISEHGVVIGVSFDRRLAVFEADAPFEGAVTLDTDNGSMDSTSIFTFDNGAI